MTTDKGISPTTSGEAQKGVENEKGFMDILREHRTAVASTASALVLALGLTVAVEQGFEHGYLGATKAEAQQPAQSFQTAALDPKAAKAPVLDTSKSAIEGKETPFERSVKLVNEMKSYKDPKKCLEIGGFDAAQKRVKEISKLLDEEAEFLSNSEVEKITTMMKTI